MVNERIAEFIHLLNSDQARLLLPEDIGAIRKNASAWVKESDKKELASLLHCYPTAEAVENQLLALANEAERQIS